MWWFIGISGTGFLQAGCPSRHPTMTAKALHRTQSMKHKPEPASTTGALFPLQQLLLCISVALNRRDQKITNTASCSMVSLNIWGQHTQQQQPCYGPLSGTTRVSRYQKKHSPTHHPDHHPTFISFFHLPRSIASSLFKLLAWQSFCTTSFHVLFGLPLGLEPSTSYSIHFFTQLVSSFCSTRPYHRNLFCCSINIISFIPTHQFHTGSFFTDN